MIFNHQSITSSGTDTITLVAAVSNSVKESTIERLLVCNTDSTDITLNLWLDDGSDQYYLAKLVSIPQAQTLDFLNGIPFRYQESYAIKASLGSAGHTADIIFNQY